MPAVQDEYPLAELLNLRQEVRGKNDRVGFAEVSNQRTNLHHLTRVKPDGRFIQHQHLRIAA